MNTRYRLFFALSALFIALTISACESEPPKATIIVIDQKMPLIEWPDSIYVNSLDSILALEPVKKSADEKKDVNLSLNSRKAPVFNLPPSVTGKKESKKDAAKNIQKFQEAHAKGATQQSGEPSGKKAEAFGDKFVRAMSALQSDPNNASLYRIVTANDEDLTSFLKRTYGAGSLTLPRFFVQSALQTINPGLNLEKLNAGDKVKVPRL